MVDQDKSVDPQQPSEKGKDRIRLQLPAKTGYVGVVRDLIYQASLNFGFPKKIAFDLKIVVGEAVENIILHAYGGESDQPIHIEMIQYDHYAELRIRDYGKKSSITSGAARDLSEFRDSGLGLYLIEQLSDYHYFDQSPEHGTLLVIKRRYI